MAWAIEDIRANLPRREKALRYYNGDHPLNFATTKFRNTFGETFQELADNLCDDVVDEPVDRLQITNWSGPGEDPTEDGTAVSPLASLAQEWWEDNRGDARSGSVHQNGFRAGDAFAIIWDAGDDVPRLYVQDPRQMAVRYSTQRPDEIEVAAKCWREGKGYRLNLYYPPDATGRARIEHYYSKGYSTASGEKGIPQASAFLPYTRAAIVDGDGNELDPGMEAIEYHDHGMPVFHFPNGDLGTYGRSALTGVYPLQDALNKLLCDFMVGAEAFSLPKRWGTGIQVPTDPVTGEEVSPFQEGKNFWWTAKEGAQFGQFSPAEMSGFLNSMRAIRLEIARKGGLPAHTVDAGEGGTAPSGLALLVAEGKLIKRCKDRQRDWGVVWRELMAFVLTWRLGRPVSASDLALEWAAVETRDEQALLETLSLKAGIGVPQVQLLREAGYTDEQIVSFGLLSEDEQARAMDAAEAQAGGRISVPGNGTLTPAPPVAPAGADQPAPAGSAA